MNIIDLSVFRKDNLTIKSLTGEEYIIPGNVPTEFYILIYDYYDKIQKSKKKDITKQEFSDTMNLLKDVALEIIKLDQTKEVTMDTINKQFNDIHVLELLLGEVMKHVNEVTQSPSSESLTSN